MNARRLELLRADPATAPHGGGVLVIDDSGDRKDGTATAHVGRQYLGRYGKTDNGVVTVTTVWADERVYYPVHAVPYTPAEYFAKGKNDPEFRTKLVIGAELAVRARAAGVHLPRGRGRQRLRRPGRVPRRAGRGGAAVRDGAAAACGTWARAADAHTPVEAARDAGLGRAGRSRRLAAGDRVLPGRPRRDLVRRQRDAGRLGPDSIRRLVVATADPGTLPDKAAWYLVTNLPRPGGPRGRPAPSRPPAWPRSCASTGSGNWIEQGVQAGQGRTRLGRFPGPLRHRDPPSPGAGHVRVLLLLACPARRSARLTSARGSAGRTRQRRRGLRPPSRRWRQPGRGPCARSAAG